ncbi:MAG: bis(5'-nucleosyl)-tetraphosphatase (symmetrical) YqeK [Clostridia bacterium]|nr:HD domain-containing protein [Oscillospiraceae bacterium]MBQ7032648.1 bis(5'-nucleosyl)-tetraphosphatase (symmetrical) YqeK [Clostridia bacterium]
MTEQTMLEKLKGMVDEKRYAHSIGVRDTAAMLARRYGVSEEKARIAGILHDCAKNIPKDEGIARCEAAGIRLKPICYIEKGLVHSYLGAHIAKTEFGITDREILDAIYYHTTGHEDMPLLTKIIYLSDLIEPGRNVPNVEELRRIAMDDIDEALIRSINSTIAHVLGKGSILDCDTVCARNFLVQQKRLCESAV